MRSNLFYKPTYRFLKIACIDEIGQDKKTFTVNENGKQNSPSFDSYNDFLLFTDKLHNRAIKADLKATKDKFHNTIN